MRGRNGYPLFAAKKTDRLRRSHHLEAQEEGGTKKREKEGSGAGVS